MSKANLTDLELEDAHAQLKQEFETINLQLEQANARLSQKVHELDATSSYLRNILSNMSQGLLFINKAGIITTYNKNAEATLQKPAVEVLFQHFSDSFDDLIFGFSIEEALKKSSAPAFSLANLHLKNEQARDLEVDARYMDKKDGIALSNHLDATLDYSEGLIILLRDVTELRRLKLLTERNERLKELGEMAAMVAHEIRNPLGGIKGFASLLRRDLESQPELKQMANYIVEGTDTLNRLVTNVLNYARPVRTELHPTDLKKLLTDIREHVIIDEKLGKLTKIKIKAEGVNCIVSVDAQLIQGALLNLIVNAIDAMPEGGTVILGLSKEKGQAVITVTDTGIGIPADNFHRIFSPFFTTKPDGNGFGLSEVYKVIQAHAGSIEVASKIGEGTTFIIKIPLRA